MKACPYCAEQIQDAAVVCKHCGRDLPAPVTPPAKPAARVGIARGMRLKVVLIAVGVAVSMSFLPSPLGTLAFLIAWGALAALLVNAGLVLRLLPTLALAFIITYPGSIFRSAREQRLAQENARKAQEASAAAQKAAAEKARAASAEAARAFPERRPAIDAQLTALEASTASKDWPAAQQKAQALGSELAPLFASDIKARTEVTALKTRFDTQQSAIAAHVREEQVAEAKKKAAEAARVKAAQDAAAAAAEKKRREAWTPDPGLMKVRCERYAKEDILDGEAEFAVGTLSKSGRNYYMKGRVIGHNAFNARIAKAATCKVYMDMKTGVETYTVSR